MNREYTCQACGVSVGSGWLVESSAAKAEMYGLCTACLKAVDDALTMGGNPGSLIAIPAEETHTLSCPCTNCGNCHHGEMLHK